MDEAVEGIVKKNAAKDGGPRRLEPAICTPQGAGRAGGPAPEAKVIQQDESATVIEVKCSCGRSIQLQCEHKPQQE